MLLTLLCSSFSWLWCDERINSSHCSNVIFLKASWSPVNNLFLFSTSDNWNFNDLIIASDPCSWFSSSWFNDNSLSWASSNWDVNDAIFSSDSVLAAATETAELEERVGSLRFYSTVDIVDIVDSSLTDEYTC